MLPPNRLSLSAEMNGTQRRTLVSPQRMHCMYCGMPKRTSQTEVMLKNEKIKPVALVITIQLRLSEGTSQSVTQSISRNSIK